MVGLGALVATAGACVALSGIGDYGTCTDTCDDAAPTAPMHDVSIPDVKAAPDDTSSSSMDVSVPTEEVSEPPPPSEAGPDDAAPEDADVSVPPMDSSPDVARPPVDSGSDADAAKDAGLGSTCGPLGTSNHCGGSQVCCANLSTQMNACAASCNANATIGCTVPTDCPSSAPICCAHMTLGGTYPACTVSLFSSTCASTCADAPPADLCLFTNGIIRLCAHDKDCMSDTANMACYQFEGAPEAWCTTMAIGGAASGVPQH